MSQGAEAIITGRPRPAWFVLGLVLVLGLGTAGLLVESSHFHRATAWILVDPGSFSPESSPDGPAPGLLAAALEGLAGPRSTAPPFARLLPGGEVVAFTATGSDPADAARRANALAARWIASRPAAPASFSSVPADLDPLRRLAEAADRRVLSFDRTVEIAAAASAAAAVDRLQARTDAARRRVAEARRRLDTSRLPLGADDAPALSALKRALSDVLARLSLAEARLGPLDPETVALDEQAASATRQIKAAVASLVSLATSEVEALAAAEAALAAGREAARASQECLARADARLRSLQDEAAIAHMAFAAALARANRLEPPVPSRPRLILPAGTPTS